MLAERDVLPERIRGLRRTEYESLVERGAFEDSRIELLHGALVEMRPQGAPHATITARLANWLTRRLPDTVEIRAHSPLAVSDDSEPEPDVSVVPSGDYKNSHPTDALLVIEVAESSLRKDRQVKTGLYAAAGIPEYWLVDLERRVAEVRRQPIEGSYKTIQRIGIDGTLSPEAFPELRLSLAELFA